MRCVKCGQELPDDANFCRRCGSPTIRNMSYLVQKARENDQEALAEIYKISSPAVYKTIRVLIKDEDTVYDILQDTYVKAFTRLNQLQNPDKLIPWLKMIANNLAKDWLKKSKPVFFTDIYGGEELEDIPFEESIEDVRSELNPEMAMDQQEAKRLVMEILDHLPEDQRVVIGMFYYEEMSVKDIAQTLGVSENTVKSRLSYGRKKIKEQVMDLEKRGTKLYSVAPFVFFLYLLGKADKVSAEPMVQKALPDIMQSYFREASGRTAFQAGVAGNSWGNNSRNPNNRLSGGAESSGQTGRSSTGPTGYDGSTGRPPGIGSPGPGAAGSNTNGWASNAAHTAASTSSKAAGTITGTAAKHAGLKIAAVILAGSLGAGGITYGVVRNIDKLPFVHQQEPQEKETAETQKEEQAEPEETPKATQVAEATDKAEEKSSEKEEKKLSEEELYRTFYDGYVKDENLQVIQDGYVADYDFNTGYANDLLLSAAMEDFGGNGNKELLLIRTRAKEKDENSSNYTDVERPLYMELYGIDDQKVTLRKELEIPDTDLNTYGDSIEEKLELRKKEGSYYLYRSGRWSPAHGASDYLDTFIKMSETDMVQECNLRWCFGATYGTCQINGRDFYTGNKDSDMQQIENQLEVYGMNGGQELTGPYLLDFNRGADLDAQTYSQRDNVILQNCFAAQPAVVSPTFTPMPTIEIPQEETGVTEYYFTVLHPKYSEGSTLPWTTQVDYNADDDTLTFYATFRKSDKSSFVYDEAIEVSYGQRTFQLTPDTKYLYNETDEQVARPKEDAVNTCVRVNGLQLLIKVVDGNVESMTFSS
ncbi:RNA polymerase sigma factor sigX [uncultured Blautia sp.]|nr:sigma-70 family RNA polymerase sigma factor [uncultured Blautia sp.]SCH04377.1 RNA polymerase sigma factor sigX [uncultured Blautia sp.]